MQTNIWRVLLSLIEKKSKIVGGITAYPICVDGNSLCISILIMILLYLLLCRFWFVCFITYEYMIDCDLCSLVHS